MKADRNHMNHFVYVKGLVGVRTNAETFCWSLGSAAPAASEDQFDVCRIKIDLKIVKDKEVALPAPLLAGEGNFRFFHGQRNEGTLVYHRRLLGLPLSYSVSVRGNTIQATVGKAYYRLIRLKVMNLHPIWYVLFDLTTMLLLKNGYLPIYASSFAFHDRGTLVMAPPNTGKTLTAIRLSENPRIRILGEDIAVTDGKRIYAVPWTNTYRNYGDESQRPAALSEEPAALRFVFLLEKGARGMTSEKADALKRISLLNHYGIGYRSSPAVTVLSYFNDDLSLEEASRREDEILCQLAQEASIYMVTSDNAAEYAGCISDLLQNQNHDINCPAALI